MTPPAKPYRLAIVACSASKLAHAAPARELYTGALFKLARELAETVADRWVILSAKHGALEGLQAAIAVREEQEAVELRRVAEAVRRECYERWAEGPPSMDALDDVDLDALLEGTR